MENFKTYHVPEMPSYSRCFEFMKAIDCKLENHPEVITAYVMDYTTGEIYLERDCHGLWEILNCSMIDD